MRMRKKPNLLPRMGRCEEYLIADPEARKGRWRELMPGCRELRLELGCGKGRFTVQTAAAEPDVLFIAVERVPDAMVIAVERAKAAALKNVFFVDMDAAGLEGCFARGEVDRIYINFCDPWPSNRHAKRRLTHPDFLARYRSVLGEGRSIHFKTDNRDLFEWSLFQFPKMGFTLSEVTRDLHADGPRGVMTDYEEKFYGLGQPINRCVATVGPLPRAALEEELARLLPGWELRPVAEDDVEAVTALFQTDPGFFALDGLQPSAALVRRDMENLPPRCTMVQKHYLALWRDGAPQAVLDLIERYPQTDRLFVGLFFLAPQLRRQGLGRQITEGVLAAGAAGGMDYIRLACLQNNPVGHTFWHAMDFIDLREARLMGPVSAPVWLMERRSLPSPA